MLPNKHLQTCSYISMAIGLIGKSIQIIFLNITQNEHYMRSDAAQTPWLSVHWCMNATPDDGGIQEEKLDIATKQVFVSCM